ncbi:hypothetical protein MBLNU459_g3023t1 [Dothideomycetes sp. NU459]
MTLKDLLRKHSNIQASARNSTEKPSSVHSGPEAPIANPIPEFTFLRTTTLTEEEIHPPSYPGDDEPITPSTPLSVEKKRRSLFHRASSYQRSRSDTNSTPKSEETNSGSPRKTTPSRPKSERKLSERLHLTGRPRGLTRENSSGSINLPQDLGEAPAPTPAPLEPADIKGRVVEVETKEQKTAREALWERRATALVLDNPLLEELRSSLENGNGSSGRNDVSYGSPTRKKRAGGSFVDEKEESNIQEAIRLHEGGDLERSTALFGRLADPQGANNPLSQVLYGLALRHGWGITSSASDAIHYLSLAASTSGQIERAALDSGSSTGGEAKGELVLAMFELANCFRHGWGTKTDKVAARTFYECAANLGDPDAQEEIAWCFMEGYGGVKDKVRAAQYYRLAELGGRKRVGESWYVYNISFV